MESTPRWGITLPLRTVPLPEQRDLVAALPDLGYTDAWSSEVRQRGHQVTLFGQGDSAERERDAPSRRGFHPQPP